MNTTTYDASMELDQQGLYTDDTQQQTDLSPNDPITTVNIFYRITAVLSDALVQMLPENKQEFFFTLLQQTKIRCEVVLLQTGQYAINGDLPSIQKIETALLERYGTIYAEETDTSQGTLQSQPSKQSNLSSPDNKTEKSETVSSGRSRHRPSRGFYADLVEGNFVPEEEGDVGIAEDTHAVRSDGDTVARKRGRGRPRKSQESGNFIAKDEEESLSKENTEEVSGDDPLREQKKMMRKEYEQKQPFKYFCKKCSFKSKRQSHFLKHLSAHRKYVSSAMFSCSLCDFKTLRKVHLRRHELEHTDASELIHCEQCSFKTFNVFHLNKHIKLKHETETKKESRLFRCPHCPYTTKITAYFERHLQAHISVVLQQPIDDDGSMGIDGSQTINLASHFINNTFHCNKCSYTTTRKMHFVRHLTNVHGNRRPFLCDLCGKSFKRPDALSQHKITHLDRNERKYKFPCPTCQKLFRSQAHLKEHSVMHTTARAFLCEICGASFKTKAVQRKHMQNIHSNPRSHGCPQCTKRFNTKYSLERHQRTHDTPGIRIMAEKVANQQQQYGEVVVGNVMQVELPTTQDPVQHVVEIHTPIIQQAGDKLEDAYHEDGTEAIQQAYIQTSEASTALLYLTSNFQSY